MTYIAASNGKNVFILKVLNILLKDFVFTVGDYHSSDARDKTELLNVKIWQWEVRSSHPFENGFTQLKHSISMTSFMRSVVSIEVIIDISPASPPTHQQPTLGLIVVNYARLVTVPLSFGRRMRSLLSADLWMEQKAARSFDHDDHITCMYQNPTQQTGKNFMFTIFLL